MVAALHAGGRFSELREPRKARNEFLKTSRTQANDKLNYK